MAFAIGLIDRRQILTNEDNATAKKTKGVAVPKTSGRVYWLSHHHHKYNDRERIELELILYEMEIGFFVTIFSETRSHHLLPIQRLLAHD